MKKIYAFLMAVIAIVTVSCNNDDKLFNEPSSANGGLKIDITVADLQSSTKAIKTGWANGDIINIYLDDKYNDYMPDFTLTYDGTKWVASTISAAVEARLKATGGKLSGFWEGSNSCIADASWSKTGGYIDFPGNVTESGLKGYMVADFQEISYTFSGGVLEAAINSWRFRSDLQIVVSGISFEDGRYTLYSDGIDNLSSINVHTYSVEHQCYVSYEGTGYEYGRVAGIANADGVAFVGGLSTTYSDGDNFMVYLIDNVTGVTYSFTKVLTESLGSDNSKVIGIKIPFNKFVVDMGLSVKWAACNLGADYLTGYGDYFAWGETTPHSGNATWGKYTFNPSADGSTFTKYTGTDYTTLQSADDVATAVLGDSYRMPTKAEWEELLNESNSKIEWVTDYLGTGINGCLVTSKKTGKTSQKIFLPRAGSHASYSASYGLNDLCFYWSSSLKTDNVSNAWRFYGNGSNALVTAEARRNGMSIRPVR